MTERADPTGAAGPPLRRVLADSNAGAAPRTGAPTKSDAVVTVDNSAYQGMRRRVEECKLDPASVMDGPAPQSPKFRLALRVHPATSMPYWGVCLAAIVPAGYHTSMEDMFLPYSPQNSPSAGAVRVTFMHPETGKVMKAGEVQHEFAWVEALSANLAEKMF